MSSSDVADFLTCPVCLDTLTEPVTLCSHHSFCHSCLRDYWGQNNTRTCPVCRRKSSKELLIINFALKQLSVSFSQRQDASASASAEKHPEVPPQKKKSGVCKQHPEVPLQREKPAVCEQHPDTPPLFCKDERRALCPVCEFSLHQRHTVVRVEEVQEELKEQMRTELESLTEQRDSYKRLESTYEQIQKHTDTQAQQCESHIRAVFKHLHQFLKQEETRALEELRKETHTQARTMSPELGRVREELASVETTIQELKELLKRDTVLHYSPQRPLLTTPALGPGLLLDQAKVIGNLGYSVWRRLRREFSYSPVILDTNTANRWLYLTEDLRGVRQGDSKHKLPDNPERFTNGPSVLGAEGFTSGTHQWGVKVGDHPSWIIGVAKESVDRRGNVHSSPTHGIWSLWHTDGIYTNHCGEPVLVQKPPEKIQVKLDCDKGRVSFYDADHMTLLYTHKHRRTEKMFPYFFVGPSGEAKTKEIRICLTEGP